MNLLSSQYIALILASEMGLPSNAVWLRDQNKTIPNDNGLYISVGIISAQTIANTVEMIFTDDVPIQVCTVQQREILQIDIFSNSLDGLTRHWEVIAALQSFYSQQIQELNNFKIFRIPQNFIDTSDAEGGSILKRYTITISCFVWYRKQSTMPVGNDNLGDYFDDFNVRVDDEATIGTETPAIEFEINSETPPPPYP